MLKEIGVWFCLVSCPHPSPCHFVCPFPGKILFKHKQDLLKISSVSRDIVLSHVVQQSALCMLIGLCLAHTYGFRKNFTVLVSRFRVTTLVVFYSFRKRFSFLSRFRMFVFPVIQSAEIVYDEIFYDVYDV